MNRSQRPYQESNKNMNSQSLSEAAATKKLVEQQADLAQEAVLGSFDIFLSRSKFYSFVQIICHWETPICVVFSLEQSLLYFMR